MHTTRGTVPMVVLTGPALSEGRRTARVIAVLAVTVEPALGVSETTTQFVGSMTIRFRSVASFALIFAKPARPSRSLASDSRRPTTSGTFTCVPGDTCAAAGVTSDGTRHA